MLKRDKTKEKEDRKEGGNNGKQKDGKTKIKKTYKRKILCTHIVCLYCDTQSKQTYFKRA
jgi:hypothetical protein